MPGFMEIVLATGNGGKIAELTERLAPLGVRVLRPDEVGGLPQVIEDQDSFEGNAAKKAASGARASGHWCLADDSGLCVDALGGAPGVHSARFAGEAADPAANNARLVAELEGLPPERRGAHFTCVLALADPANPLAPTLFSGRASGRILDAPRGDGGFGYDPLFLFTEPGHPQTGYTFAELSRGEKAAVSHRGRALIQLAEHLARWTRS